MCSSCWCYKILLHEMRSGNLLQTNKYLPEYRLCNMCRQMRYSYIIFFNLNKDYYLTLDGTSCVKDCYSADGSLIPSDEGANVIEKKCVSSCASNEYITNTKKCGKCSTISKLCIKCDDGTTCL